MKEEWRWHWMKGDLWIFSKTGFLTDNWDLLTTWGLCASRFLRWAGEYWVNLSWRRVAADLQMAPTDSHFPLFVLCVIPSPGMTCFQPITYCKSDGYHFHDSVSKTVTCRQAVSPMPSHLHTLMKQAAMLERSDVARNCMWSLANSQRGTESSQQPGELGSGSFPSRVLR